MYSKQNNRINSRIVFTMFLRRKNITLSFYWTCNDFRLNLETQLSNSGLHNNELLRKPLCPMMEEMVRVVLSLTVAKVKLL